MNDGLYVCINAYKDFELNKAYPFIYDKPSNSMITTFGSRCIGLSLKTFDDYFKPVNDEGEPNKPNELNKPKSTESNAEYVKRVNEACKNLFE